MTDKKSSRGKFVWMDGEFIPTEDAKLHIDTECVMRGANVFEGIRGYWNSSVGQLYLMKMDEHMDRLFDVSMKVMRMSIPYSREEIVQLCIDLVRMNDYREDIALRPTVYFGAGKNFGFRPEDIHVGAFIKVGSEPPRVSLKDGLRCCVSTWTRLSDSSSPPRVKAGANYQNNRLAMYDAFMRGYDHVIIRTQTGTVSEGSGCCLFIVRDSVLITPPVTDGILESITRKLILELAKTDLAIEVVERSIDRTELYVADEVLLCGTNMEITPVVEVDGYVVGAGFLGPITSKLQGMYFDIVRGRDPRRMSWLTPVY